MIPTPKAFWEMTEEEQDAWYLACALRVLRDAAEGVTEDLMHAVQTSLDYLYYLDK